MQILVVVKDEDGNIVDKVGFDGMTQREIADTDDETEHTDDSSNTDDDGHRIGPNSQGKKMMRKKSSVESGGLQGRKKSGKDTDDD